MRYPGAIAAAAAACALALGGLGTSAATASSPPEAPVARPALWRTYDLIVNLQNLPRTYTCDQLWYEFHGILLRMGAWPYSLDILPYDCSPSASGGLRSPNVQVRFQLPFFLPGAVKLAPAKAIERTLRLSPGEPKTLHSSDCQLMRQISRTLLTSVPARIDEEHFDCSGPARRAAHFYVSLSLPMAVKIPAVAATSAPAPH
jgi:hypothetical protein